MLAQKIDEFEAYKSLGNDDYLSPEQKADLEKTLAEVKNGTAVLYTQAEFEKKMDEFFEKLRNRKK